MDIAFENLSSKVKPAPNTSLARRITPWEEMSNENLKFALDTLSLHHSPYEVDAMNEIQKRVMAGTWLDIDQHTPTHAPGMPKIFYVWPFSLFWKQRPQG